MKFALRSYGVLKTDWKKSYDYEVPGHGKAD